MRPSVLIRPGVDLSSCDFRRAVSVGPVVVMLRLEPRDSLPCFLRCEEQVPESGFVRPVKPMSQVQRLLEESANPLREREQVSSSHKWAELFDRMVPFPEWI